MRTIGRGSGAWRVRVDLFANETEPRSVEALFDGLVRLSEGDPEREDVGIDQGLGVTDRPVTGFLFWVRADDVGHAATTAVEIARQVGSAHGVSPDLFDVTVIPEQAVIRPQDPAYPDMPD
jgi:hypothetical protein